LFFHFLLGNFVSFWAYDVFVVKMEVLCSFYCRKVVWLSDVDRTKGYAVDFLSLSLHAVSRDPEAYSSPCIYTQVRFLCSSFGVD
jgi:hypothetical protein